MNNFDQEMKLKSLWKLYRIHISIIGFWHFQSFFIHQLLLQGFCLYNYQG
jgi:pyridoxine/pyridoxamine 5'-phosphate oxidase